MTCPLLSLKLRNMAQIPNFVREPEQHLVEMRFAYKQIQVDVQKLRRRLVKVAELPTSTGRLHSTCLAAHGLLLCEALIVNAVLRAFNPYDSSLIEDSASFSNETVTLAEEASQYRPIGASHVPLCLIVAWAATDDMSRRVEIERVLADYQADFMVARWLDSAFLLDSQFQDLRRRIWTPHLDSPRKNTVMGANTCPSNMCSIQ